MLTHHKLKISLELICCMDLGHSYSFTILRFLLLVKRKSNEGGTREKILLLIKWAASAEIEGFVLCIWNEKSGNCALLLINNMLYSLSFLNMIIDWNFLLVFQPAGDHIWGASESPEWFRVLVWPEACQTIFGVSGSGRGQKTKEATCWRWKGRYFIFQDKTRGLP